MANIDNYIFKVLSFNVDSAGEKLNIHLNMIDTLKYKINLSTTKFDISTENKSNRQSLINTFNTFLDTELKNNLNYIFLISLQEDEKKSILFDNIQIMTTIQNNRYEIIDKEYGSGNYYIHNIILYPSKINFSIQECLFIKHLYKLPYNIGHINMKTKGSIITPIEFANNCILYFVSSHLTIDTNNTTDLGFIDRCMNILDVLTKIDKLCQKNVSIKPIIIWGGDLNFRYDLDGIEQLSMFIEEFNKDLLSHTKIKSSYAIQDLSQINNFAPTCKVNIKTKNTVVCKDFYKNNNNIKLIKNKDYLCDKTNCKSLHNESHLSCYDDLHKRIPSYCDRIIALTDNRNKFLIKFNTNALTEDFSTYSDHNPIYSSIQITLSASSESYAKKYYSYKSIFLSSLSK
jgi:hypothetical protein